MTRFGPQLLVPPGLAGVAAFAVWRLVATLGRRREAWDSDLYWTLGVPLLAVVAFACGFAARSNPWHVGAAIAIGQAVAMVLPPAGGFGLLPLGLVLLAVLSLPLVLVAWTGKRIRG